MSKWTTKAGQVFSETHDALQTVYDNMNKGQRQKLLKVEEVKKLFDRYEVNYDNSTESR